MKEIDCKTLRENVLKKTEYLKKKCTNVPCIKIFANPEDKASTIYLRNKIKTMESTGIVVEVDYCRDINNDKEWYKYVKNSINRDVYTGYIFQLPLPSFVGQKSLDRILERLKWYEDIDGISSKNIGRLYTNEKCIKSATAQAIMECLPDDLTGKYVDIINRSRLIGLPLTKMILDRNGTPIVYHSKSKVLLSGFCGNIIISGVGNDNFTLKYNPFTVNSIIDAGIRVKNGKIVGDQENMMSTVYFDDESIQNSIDKINITPVPGGIGILTTAYITKNAWYGLYSKEKLDG